ncbi:MAG: hypothetical protein V5783_04720, partial [Pontiella sp.]
LNATLDGTWNARTIAGKWTSSATKNNQWYMGTGKAWGGDWVELKAGEPLDLEILIGEQPGGNFSAMLLVEVEGVEYEMNPQNQKFLPIFRTAPTTHAMADAIMEHLVEGEADVFGGPIFQDYAPSIRTNEVAAVEPEIPVAEEAESESLMRLWTLNNGKTFEAEYVTTMGDKLVVRTARGKQVKVPYGDISPEDIAFIQRSNPPEFDVGIVRSSKSFKIKMSAYALKRDQIPPRVLDWTFGAKVRQKGLGDYPFELKLEYFIFAQQYLDPNKYWFLDYQSSVYTPTPENEGSYRFTGDGITRLFDFDLVGQRRGHKLSKTLVLLTDSRGEIIAHSSTANWLIDNLDELRKRKVGDYIDQSCKQVYASGPKKNPNLY